MTRTAIKVAASKFLSNTGIDRVFQPAHAPVVLAYHRVVEDFASSAANSNPSMLVSVEMLEKHLDWIGRRYRFVGLDELGARMEACDPAVPSLAAVTFDDGYRDFYDVALPLLRRKGIPAALFVVTDYVGGSRVPLHDKIYLLLKRRRRALPKLPDLAVWGDLEPYSALRTMLEVMPAGALEAVVEALETADPLPGDVCAGFRNVSWEELRNIQRAGITIGSHTRTHVLMPNETWSRVKDEAAGSRQILQQRLGAPVRHFAYPSGAFDARSIRAVAAAGYRFAYATTPGPDPDHPLLTIPRTVLWEKSSATPEIHFSGAILDCLIHHTFDRFAEKAPRARALRPESTT